MNYRRMAIFLGVPLFAHSKPYLSQWKASARNPVSFNTLINTLVFSNQDLEKLISDAPAGNTHPEILSSVKTTLLSSDTNNPHLQRIYFRLTEFPGAILSLTKMLCDEAVFYSGRISSIFNEDSLQLKFRKGKYYFAMANTIAIA